MKKYDQNSPSKANENSAPTVTPTKTPTKRARSGKTGGKSAKKAKTDIKAENDNEQITTADKDEDGSVEA